MHCQKDGHPSVETIILESRDGKREETRGMQRAAKLRNAFGHHLELLGMMQYPELGGRPLHSCLLQTREHSIAIAGTVQE